MRCRTHLLAIFCGYSLTLPLLLGGTAFPRAAHGQKRPDRQKIVVVCDDSYPPYSFREASGKLRGILPEQWALWEQKTGVQVDFEAMAWSEAQRVMREGRADVIDTIFFTEERAKLLDFTPAYARIEVPVYVHKTLGGVGDIASLKGFTVGVKAGDAVIDYLSARGIASLKEYPSYEAVILAAKSQEIKVFTVDQPAAVYFLYKHGLATEFRQSFVLVRQESLGDIPHERRQFSGRVVELLAKRGRDDGGVHGCLNRCRCRRLGARRARSRCR